MKPLAPRDWKSLNAFKARKPKPFVLPRFGGKKLPCFNGSLNNRRNKKRPITLATKA